MKTAKNITTMNFIEKYSTFSKGFYLLMLGLAIPFYLLLYGASGHQFNPPAEDVIWMLVVVVSFVTFIVYLAFKRKSGSVFTLLRVLVTITLLLAAFGGLRIFMFMIQFSFGSDIGFLIRGLFYILPLLFVFSTIIILVGIYKLR